jgi:hypothetical protein
MEEIKTINAKILEITLKIQKKYPELTKYIEEIPVTIPTEKKPEINLKTLKDYYNTLLIVAQHYELEKMSKKLSESCK